MDKREFLNTLKEQLDGTMDPRLIAEHLNYYDQYITDAVRSGKTQEEVMEELGSPVFIAKTLEDVAESTGGSEQYEHDFREEYQDAYESGNVQDDSIGGKIRSFLMKPKVLNILGPIILILICVIAFFVLGAVATVAVRFLVPILVILFVVSLFRNGNI